MEMLINYNLRSMSSIDVDQYVLIHRLVYAFIVRKPTTSKSDFLEKRLSASKCFNDLLKQNGQTLIVESSSIII